MGIYLCDLGVGNGFLNITPEAQVKKENLKHWISPKLKAFVLQTSSGKKKQHRMGKIFADYKFNKEILERLYNEFF